MVPGFGAVGGDGEALVAGRHQLDRPVEPPRRDGDQRGALGQRAARAEGAADKGRDDADVRRVDAELLGQPVLEARTRSGWASQTVSLPPSQAQVVVNSSIGLWCWVGVA